MRHNHGNIIKAFLDGRIAAERNLFTDGSSIYHHGTCIATTGEMSARLVWIVNVTYYSKTTSTLRNALLSELDGYGNVIRIDNCPKGITAIGLTERYASLPIKSLAELALQVR